MKLVIAVLYVLYLREKVVNASSAHHHPHDGSSTILTNEARSPSDIWEPLTPRYQGQELAPQDLRKLLIDETGETPSHNDFDTLYYDSPGTSHHSSNRKNHEIGGTSSDVLADRTQQPSLNTNDHLGDETWIEYDSASDDLQSLSSQTEASHRLDSPPSDHPCAHDIADPWWRDLNQQQIALLAERLRGGWGLKDPRTNPWYIMKRAEHTLSRDEAMTVIYGARHEAIKVAKDHQRLKNHAPYWLMSYNTKERKKMYNKYAYYHNVSQWTARTQINECDSAQEVQMHLDAIEEGLTAHNQAHLLYANARLRYSCIDDAEAAILLSRATSTCPQWHYQLDESARLNVYKRALRIIPQSILTTKKDRMDEVLTPELAKGLVRQNQSAQKEFLRALTALQ